MQICYCAKPGHLMQSVHVAQFFIIQELLSYYCNNIIVVLFLKSPEVIFITIDCEDGCICTFYETSDQYNTVMVSTDTTNNFISQLFNLINAICRVSCDC